MHPVSDARTTPADPKAVAEALDEFLNHLARLVADELTTEASPATGSEEFFDPDAPG